MRLKVRKVSEGAHRDEVVVSVAGVDGERNVVLARREVVADSIDIGFPLKRNDDDVLVELPRTTEAGTARLWVKSSLVVGNAFVDEADRLAS